jgi:Ras GTPase-activating protein 1
MTFFVTELEDWLSAIKPLCVPQMVRSPKVAKLREVRTLHLALSEAHRLPLKLVPNPYFVVTFNQVSMMKCKGIFNIFTFFFHSG